MNPRGTAENSLLALTFDDGPSPWTVEILDLLAEHRARATFFVLGASIARRESTLRRTIAEGHQLGLHSWSHPHLGDLSPDEIREEMLRTQTAIERATGTVARIWRPPYFEADERVRRALAASKLIEIGCTIAPEDYHWSAERTAVHVLERLQPGAIIDLHDGRPSRSGSDQTRAATVEALDLVLREMKRRSLRSVPVSELPPLAIGDAT
ncbi:MAG: polysaccharide deacetylase family protein [Gaiellaceae bacterium]